MAGAKESPRQKMINLMYLVFIAMLALNMSKEVLTAFGQITEQVEDNNSSLDERIQTFEETINKNFNSEGQQEVWAEKKWAMDQIGDITSKFVNHISSLPRKDMPMKEVKGLKNPIVDYEIMDKPDYYDKKFFANSAANAKLTKQGEDFVNNVRSFKDDFVKIIDSLLIGDKNNLNYQELKVALNETFNVDDKIKDREGKDLNWIERYHGYPEVTSNTRLAMLKSNAMSFKAQLLSFMIGGQYKVEATLANFDAYVVSDRSAYYPGSNFSGKIILGKKSRNLVPKSVTINNNEIDPKEKLNSEGAVILDFPVGRTGQQQIEGTVVFEEGGELISIPVSALYDVIEKPNSASVEVVGRNTLFRNYDNEVIVSLPGISSNAISVSSSGASVSKKGRGRFTVRPKSGSKLTLSVSGTTPNGDKFSDKKEFIIRSAPEPTILFNGKETGKMSKGSIASSYVSARYPPAYGISKDVKVSGFRVKIGPKNFNCSGNKLSSKAKSFLKKAPKGFDITIKDINYKGITVGRKTLGPSITIN